MQVFLIASWRDTLYRGCW